jgi:hypothetical protein
MEQCEHRHSAPTSEITASQVFDKPETREKFERAMLDVVFEAFQLQNARHGSSGLNPPQL